MAKQASQVSNNQTQFTRNGTNTRRTHSPAKKPSHAQNFAFLPAPLVDLLMSDLWIWGMTPPPAMVALMRASNSSSPRMANCKWRGVIRLTFKSLQAFPANSNTSAVKYSRIAEVYTAAVAPTRCPWCTEFLRKRWTRPTGNWRPALDERDCGAFLEVGALPPLPPLPPFPPLPDWK